MAATNQRSFLIDVDGVVWAFGDNTNGELGMGPDIKVVNQATRLQGFPPIQNIVCSNNHTLFLDVHGTVWACGRNSHQQLGLTENRSYFQFEQVNLPEIVRIACGTRHSVCLGADGNVWVCGDNKFGQLGMENVTVQEQFTKNGMQGITEIHANGNYSIFLDGEGKVWGCGDNAKLTLTNKCANKQFVPKQIEGIPRIKQIAGGYYHLMLTDFDCFVWVVGDNTFGQLGYTQRAQLHASLPKRVDFLSNVQMCSGGWTHSVIIDVNNVAHVAGRFVHGGDGFNNRTDYNLFTPLQDVPLMNSVCSGWNHSVLADVEGNVWGFGDAKGGKLGTGKEEAVVRSVFPPVKIEVGNLICRFERKSTKSARKV